ncbi:GyrI-like domain-containing protein [Tissierella carlieri]|uniref:GyrI-like domain-containing protein n=1 Tax=Tissierella carlieri TaxID=689904 RepID=A0ABT1S6Q7_9FIRM|nr:effector binding domain-containing protein [Tissierella carlieri]MBU5314506.1 GyrI-like domain-containing protein [Tissierella carlieri]MCQ4922164.1 GyrI-like domain-containing protein [Tissierella carlieri]
MINTQDIRFVQIPAMSVASIQCISTSPEKDSLKAIIDFMGDIKLDNEISFMRHFGYVPQFDKCGNADIDIFERLITVPENIEIAEPFVKKIFPGGLYAAYTVPIGFFDRVSKLKDIVCAMPNYELADNEQFDVIEEYLNPWKFPLNNINQFFTDTQIDILIKVQKLNSIN